MCWHRNIMVHKCFCAMKQIGRSKYIAKNQTICFKRSQELLKPSWNTAGEKAAAAPIPEAGWHCSPTTCGSTVLPSWPASHGFQRAGKIPSVIPRGSARWPKTWEKKVTKLLGFNHLLMGNWSPIPRWYHCSHNVSWVQSWCRIKWEFKRNIF